LGPLFDPAIEQALRLLPETSRFQPVEKLNGLFSMTADNLPLVGPAGAVQGLWFAEAVWVTHAAGAAEILATWMASGDVQRQFLTLRPDRFDAESRQALQARSLQLYRDIYGQGRGE
jgi:glycine/D-amino acid oxidase-like deaminating enzyme